MKIFHELKTDTWVKPFIKKYRRLLFLAITLGFLTFFSGAALMFTSGYLISRAASRPENILMIYIPVVFTRAFGIARPSFRYIERLTSHNWVLKMTSDLRKKLYLALEHDFERFQNKLRLGEILGLLSEDIGHLQNLYLRTIFPLLIALAIYVFAVLALGFFSVFFALMMLLLLSSVLFVFPLVSLLKLGATQERQKAQRNELYTRLTDNVLGVADWLFSGRSEDFIESYEEEEKQLRQQTWKMHGFAYRRNFLLEVFFGCIVLAMLLWVGQYFQGINGGAANWIAAFVLCVFPLVDVFSPLSDAFVETNNYADSIKRLNELPKEMKKSQEKKVVSLAHRTIQVKNLHFAYEKEEEVLKGIDLEVKQGEKLAILGKSGSGKSTLAKLLRGNLTKTKGIITIGDTPIEQLIDTMPELIGVIHQNPYLFHTTLRNNLRIGDESATDERLWQILQAVGLKEMVEKLPRKLDTMVDEAGLRFSGGERHRLAFARILLKSTPIVILDEVTVGLDPITENALLESFFKLLEDKTVIWITHHLLGVKYMDRVVFLEGGKVAIHGTPKELEKKNERYKKLLLLDRGWE